MKWKAWLLPLFLGGALSSIYLLPKAGETAQSAVRMELPESLGDWWLKKIHPSDAERDTLGPETDFSKAQCFRARPGEFSAEGGQVPDVVELSIVLSGSDLNTSIHRPERCMPAQGHVITGSSPVRFQLANGRGFDAKCLRSVLRLPRDTKKTVVDEYEYLTYYFFVGHDRITNDHFERTLEDMKERLVNGLDQRWAYVSFSMMHAKVPWIKTEVSETEADEKLRAFINDFAAKQINWEQVER